MCRFGSCVRLLNGLQSYLEGMSSLSSQAGLLILPQQHRLNSYNEYRAGVYVEGGGGASSTGHAAENTVNSTSCTL